MRLRGLFLAALLWPVACAVAADLNYYVDRVAPLIDPVKLSTLGKRKANPRVQKVVAWLATAKADMIDPVEIIDAALRSVCMTNLLAAALTKAALLRNLSNADTLCYLDAEAIAGMKRGNAPVVKRGPYRGDPLSVDHIIPRSVVPELDNVIANLELLPLRLNEKKNAKIGQRQLDLATKLYRAGLLSKMGLKSVQARR